MIRTRHLLAPIVLTFALPLGAQAAEAPATLILHNAEVYTPAGWNTALAIRDGVIVVSGMDDEALALRGPDTRVIDADGATIFPGLHDLHVHPLGAGMMQQQCIFPQGSSREQLLAAVQACASNRAPGEWIVGGQWDAASFGTEPMHRSMLDEVARRIQCRWSTSVATASGSAPVRLPWRVSTQAR